MTYEAAKCPTCGAGIQVPSEAQSAFCPSCGNRIEPKKAIALLKLDVSEALPVKGLSSVENDLLRGKQCLEAKDWQEAYKVFCMAIDKQADCFDAWYGCLSAMVNGILVKESNWVRLNGSKGIDSAFRNCFQYLPENDPQKALEGLYSLLKKLEDESSKNLQLLSDASRTFSIGCSAVVFAIIFLFILIALSLGDKFRNMGSVEYTLYITVGIIIFFGVIPIGRSNQLKDSANIHFTKVVGEKLKELHSEYLECAQLGGLDLDKFSNDQ